MGADFNRNSAARTVQRAKIATSISRCEWPPAFSSLSRQRCTVVELAGQCGDRSAEKADAQQCCTSAWHEDA
jgi:hypothetical protein